MLLTRTIASVALIAAIGLLLWSDHRFGVDFGFQIVIFAAVVLSVEEFYHMTIRRGYTPYRLWGTICAGLLVLADWAGRRNFHAELHFVGIVGFVFLAGLFGLQGWLRPRRQGLISMAVTAFAIVYIWGLAQFIVRTRYLWADHPERGVLGVVWMVAVVKFSDIAAYLIGRSFGRHKPFSTISPNKSVEGYVAGLVGALIAGVVGGRMMFSYAAGWKWVIFAVIVYVFGALGDLFESIMKRDLETKDSGTRFPGLGGVLDVFDSILLAGPVAFYLLEQLFA